MNARSPGDDLAADFLQFMEVERSSSPRTLENYRHALDEFRARHRGFTSWEALTADDFRRYLFEQMKAGTGPGDHPAAFRGVALVLQVAHAPPGLGRQPAAGGAASQSRRRSSP